MNERDELARIARVTDETDTMLWSNAEAIADAILAAGYRKPRTITTAEELDALAEGTIILTPNRNPDYPHLFRKVSRNQWSEQDPGDRSDGEDTTTSGGLLRWDSADNTATVLWEPR